MMIIIISSSSQDVKLDGSLLLTALGLSDFEAKAMQTTWSNLDRTAYSFPSER